MDHQNWDNITFSNVEKNTVNTKKRELSQKATSEDVKFEAPTNLGTLISQARTTMNKTQKVLANELGISTTILARWESNKEVPTNANIAHIEKHLCVKLPRARKVKITD